MACFSSMSHVERGISTLVLHRLVLDLDLVPVKRPKP